VGSWFRNPGAGVAASASAGCGGKYRTTRTTGSYDDNGNATAVHDLREKRKVKMLLLAFKFPLKTHKI
jgi:hypothetical protein